MIEGLVIMAFIFLLVLMIAYYVYFLVERDPDDCEFLRIVENEKNLNQCWIPFFYWYLVNKNKKKQILANMEKIKQNEKRK